VSRQMLLIFAIPIEFDPINHYLKVYRNVYTFQ
jgi:hypothetical protein